MISCMEAEMSKGLDYMDASKFYKVLRTSPSATEFGS